MVDILWISYGYPMDFVDILWISYGYGGYPAHAFLFLQVQVQGTDPACAAGRAGQTEASLPLIQFRSKLPML